MEIAFEDDRWLKAAPALSHPRAGSPNPEWSVLRARFLAAHQARQVLEPATNCAIEVGQGSFDPKTAYCLRTRADKSGFVNRDDSTDGNPGEGINAVIAGSSSTGDRGQK